MSRNKRYDEEFKKTIVDLYNSGKGATELSREYGLANSTIYEWVRDYSPIKTDDGEITNNKEIKALKKGAPTDVSDAADSATTPRAKKKSSRKQAAARSRNARKQKK